MPQDYLDFCLMQFYRCTPQELDEMDNATVEMHTEFIRIQNDEREKDYKRQEQQRKLKS